MLPMTMPVTPLRATDSIMWTLKFPIRTTEEGKAQPFDHYATGDDDLKSPTLMCEPAGLNTEKGPVQMDKVPTL